MSQRFENFVGLISAINKEVTRIKTDEMRRYGLHGTDGIALYYLQKEPAGVTSAQLARMMSVDRAVVSRSISRLSSGGFVTIDPVGGARGGKPILLTDKGDQVIQECDDFLGNVVKRAGKGLDLETRDAMYFALSIINKNLSHI